MTAEWVHRLNVLLDLLLLPAPEQFKSGEDKDKHCFQCLSRKWKILLWIRAMFFCFRTAKFRRETGTGPEGNSVYLKVFWWLLVMKICQEMIQNIVVLERSASIILWDSNPFPYILCIFKTTKCCWFCTVLKPLGNKQGSDSKDIFLLQMECVLTEHTK